MYIYSRYYMLKSILLLYFLLYIKYSFHIQMHISMYSLVVHLLYINIINIKYVLWVVLLLSLCSTIHVICLYLSFLNTKKKQYINKTKYCLVFFLHVGTKTKWINKIESLKSKTNNIVPLA